MWNSNQLCSIFLHCFRDGRPSFLESLFQDWSDHGMVIRLDIWHWICTGGMLLWWSSRMPSMECSSVLSLAQSWHTTWHDMDQPIQAIRKGNKDFSQYSDEEMLSFVKPHQTSAYLRRMTRGVQVSWCYYFVHFPFQEHDIKMIYTLNAAKDIVDLRNFEHFWTLFPSWNKANFFFVMLPSSGKFEILGQSVDYLFFLFLSIFFLLYRSWV